MSVTFMTDSDPILRYDAQTLTEDQKTQARANLGMTDGIIARSLKDGNYNVLAVNHRGYSTVAPENTIPAFILSKEKGFNYVECDISFTADGVPVLLHDDTIDRTSDGSGNVSAMTYEELLTYDFGSWKSEDYAGTKIATFEEFLHTCRGLGLHPYIELKNGTEAQTTALVNTVKTFGMRDRVTYISFNSDILEYVKNADPCARLGYLLSIVDSGAIATAISLRSGYNEVFVDAFYANTSNDTVALCIEAGIQLELWTVNAEADVLASHPYVSGVTSDNIIAGKVLEDAYKVYTPPVDHSTIAEQWANNGSADITEAIMQHAGVSYEPPYSYPSNSRAAYVGLELTVSDGDVISVDFQNSKMEFQWAFRLLNQAAVDGFNRQETISIFDTGWLTADYTIPNAGYKAIWLQFAVKDSTGTTFTLEDLGTVIVSKH